MSQKFLFQNRTTNGNGDAVLADIADEECEVVIYGAFDGATVTLEQSPDNGATWFAVRDLGGIAVSVTSARAVPLKVAYNEMLRAVQASSGASTSITAILRSIGRGA